jgi:phosphoribosylglycinamide formyltransferase 1
VNNQSIPYLQPHTIKLAIFASGAGTNAEKIITYFKQHPTIQVALVVCNKEKAGVIQIAANHQIHTLIIEKQAFFNEDGYLPILKEYGIDWLILAGFLWKIPTHLLQVFSNKVINIHPALLPKYGGKGMYGMQVHEAVVTNKETETGITIHFANEHYDEGKHIAQYTCPILPTDTAADVAKKVNALEHAYFAKTIEGVLMGT